MKLLAGLFVGCVMLAVPTAAAADAVTLVCSGTQIVTQSTLRPDPNSYSGGSWDTTSTPTGFDFTLKVDVEAQSVELNGAPVTVRRFDNGQIVFNRSKSRLLAAALKQPDYALDRQTGVIRFNGGSGRCRRVEAAPVL